MKFTDAEIRAAFLDAKQDREIASQLELAAQARIEHVKMTALMRWIHDRQATRKGGRRG